MNLLLHFRPEPDNGQKLPDIQASLCEKQKQILTQLSQLCYTIVGCFWGQVELATAHELRPEK